MQSLGIGHRTSIVQCTLQFDHSVFELEIYKLIVMNSNVIKSDLSFAHRIFTIHFNYVYRNGLGRIFYTNTGL